MEPEPSSGAPAEVTLAEFGGLIALLEQARSRHAQLEARASALQRDGLMVVEGERSVLQQLAANVKQAQSLVDEVRAAKPGGVRVLLDELRGLLDPEVWLAADSVAAQLEAKEQWQTTRLNQALAELNRLKEEMAELVGVLNEAARTGAPVRDEERLIRPLEAYVQTAERAWVERQCGKLVQMLEKPPRIEQKEKLAEQIRLKTKETRTFSRQADLLLLRSSLDALQRYQFTVLLRTPSEPGTHGINIQGLRTLVKQDRQRMQNKIERLTQAINAGQARQWQSRQATAPTAASPAPGSTGGPLPSPPTPAPDVTRRFVPGTDADAAGAPRDLNTLVRDMGDFMFRVVVPEQMQEYLQKTPCAITVTTNDLELPWELMHFGGEFLCLQRPVSRMPMGRDFPRTRVLKEPALGRKLRFLLVCSDPHGNLPAARREVDSIHDRLKETWGDRIEIERLASQEAGGDRLNEVLLTGGYDVIHYAGHASFDKEHPDLSGLLLAEDEVFFAQKIRQLLEGRPLVFLNACESGRSARDDGPQEASYLLQESAEGLASAFIYGGALACIGSLWPIYDAPAADFATNFYRHVLEGHMIGEAMRLARREVKQAHKDQITWAAFVLYGDATFKLT